MKKDSMLLAFASSLGICTIVMFCFFAIASQQREVTALQQQMLQYDQPSHPAVKSVTKKAKLSLYEKQMKHAILTSGDI